MGRRMLSVAAGLGPWGGGSLPESITDDFAADSGLWLDGNLAAAPITVSGGRGIWTPTGTELNTGPNATSDPNGNEANATTGYNPTNATLSVEATDTQTGDYSMRISSTSTVAPAARLLGSAVNAWILVTAYMKRETTPTFRVELPAIMFLPVNNTDSVGTDWQRIVISSRNIIGAAAQVRFRFLNENGVTALLDNVSKKQLAMSTQIRWRRVYYVSEIAAKIRRTVYTQSGLIIGKDINNYILLYLTGEGNLALHKNVAGTQPTTYIASGAAVYGAGQVVKLTPNSAFTAFTGSYNDSAIFSDAAIADFAADVSGGKFTVPYYAGMFTVYNSGSVDNDSFDDFAAWKLGGAYPF